jgi:hypothetical protein
LSPGIGSFGLNYNQKNSMVSIIHFLMQYFSVLTSGSHVPGIIKLALLLWDTWVSQVMFVSTIFQHGTFDPPFSFLFPLHKFSGI